MLYHNSELHVSNRKLTDLQQGFPNTPRLRFWDRKLYLVSGTHLSSISCTRALCIRYQEYRELLRIRIMAPSTHHTMGGLTVDTDRHVLDTNGEVIPGLYPIFDILYSNLQRDYIQNKYYLFYCK